MGRRGRKVTEFTRQQVPQPLSEAEQAIKARELAEICHRVDKEKADAADAAATARKSIRALDKQRRVLAECVRTGTQMVDAQLGFEDSERKKEKGRGANGSVDA